ncbi:Cytochrome P450 OS=Tsukamurella paurometabola (strain ATCC 8368 / DSM / CCUG 35730 / CIP 100753/ JCM 10117 / KCTC 9821 / NBRC 16120 / NCIMB 702349 / NCTC 13040) OX=521096 GN=Tpau_2227 PE=3 SV=1 [Tsukamurella paurometabola]|uniref:Cytochrome P450 n=1 Tax=Tsukamurella paurometabola (strain ATCC 8368 / DSM 20162 / CCUG 35730 / CIP 100753 / JCM 10117 / KCTC 9821 / NBRC 16120 / NCIMB 702349 / NCTC 13040) TaxID=521096 RepID=D5UQ66_TSUPD|nr:cytochrome P450 [Tsukamurella paurometabola]ADG78836.1 cytochrome P450 [Tsukamurella paurometabola DSM 20162]SUP33285.1 Cytochrome P450(BM-3) [Tsukamurella paurometabola]
MAADSIPHPPWRVPFLGDVLGIDRAHPMQQATAQFREWGPILKRTFAGHDFVAVGSAELADAVFDDENWRKYVGPPLRALRPLAGQGMLIQPDGADWARGHAAAAPAFARGPMEGYHHVIVESLDRAAEYLRCADGAVDTFEFTSALTLHIACMTTFGESDVVIGGEPSPVSTALTRTLRAITSTSMIAPRWDRRRRPRTWRAFDRDVAMLHEIVDRAARKRTADGATHRDILHHLLNPPAGVELRPEEVRDHAVVFLLAGHETTASSMATALHFLATHPDVADRVRVEAASVDPREYADVARLRYTRAVVHETLRLWPPTSGVFRQAKYDTQLGGHAIAAGEWVFVVLLAAQRDTSWGPRADDFDPDRFLHPETGKARVASLFKPFGHGPRQCIGRAFALHELTLALAVLLRDFDVHGDPDYTLHMSEAVTTRPKGLQLQFAHSA